MIRITDAFIYEKREEFLFIVDPRAKMFMLGFFFLIAVLSQYMIVQLTIIGLHFAISVWGGIVKKWLRSFASVLPFATFIFIITYLIEHNLTKSILPSMRLLALVGVFSIFFISTSPDYFAMMMEKIGIPQTIALAFSMALRFIPVLAQESQEVMDAQRSRGLTLDVRNPIKRIRGLTPVFIPIIILSIKRSIEVAEALEVRGFSLGKKRTHLVELQMGRRDLAFLVVNAAVFGFYLYLHITGVA